MKYRKRVERRYVYKWYGVLVTYYISTTLLVMIQIPYTQKWAAQYNAPLHSVKHTIMGKFINNKYKKPAFAGSFIHTQFARNFR